MKRKINDFFTPLSKRPNIVSHILQTRDQNLPVTAIKKEPKEVKFDSKYDSKPFIKKENDVLKIEPTSPKQKSIVKPSSQDKRVLGDLGKSVNRKFFYSNIHFSAGLTVDDAELVAETLPWSQKRNAAGVAAFAAFIHLRQEVHVRRTRDPTLTAPFTDNETLQNFYFTNIFREADNGTKYYRRQMFEQHKELTPEELPEVLFQTYIYRLVNKKLTFQRFGGIPTDSEWAKFREFMKTCMREEREERDKPKKKQNKDKLEKFFTQAHINQGENKTAITIEYVKNHKERMAKQILTATSLKKVWEVVKTPPHVGDFLSWQITADICELKLIKLREDFAALGPGARAGLRKVFDDKVSVSDEQEMTKTLTRLMDPVFEKLGISFHYFLGRGISMKAIEHSLCEFDKFYRAVIEKTSKRKYRVGGGATTTKHLSCALCEDNSLFCVVEDIWWLCARCTALECNNLGSISEIKLKKVRVEVKKIKTDTI